jgi:anti-anti-sigma regulatory factor
MESGNSPKVVNLSGSLSVERAAGLKSEIWEALSESDNVLLSLSLVEDLDLACIQVFYAAKASAASLGKELHFLGSVPSRVAKKLAATGFLRSASERAEEFESALVGF